jgi:hypothetical protein
MASSDSVGLPSPGQLHAHGEIAAGSTLPDVPNPRTPDSREQQPVWDIIQDALAQAPAVVRATPKVDPDDWFMVLTAALNMVIATRERDAAKGPTVPPDSWGRMAHNLVSNHIELPGGTPPSAGEMALAYADHYLQMRADAFNLGPDSRKMLQAAVVNYDLLKTRGLIVRTGRGAASPATKDSMFWGMKGIEDGFKDRASHPHKVNAANIGLAGNEIGRFAVQATLLSAQVFLQTPLLRYFTGPR